MHTEQMQATRYTYRACQPNPHNVYVTDETMDSTNASLINLIQPTMHIPPCLQ